LTPKVTRVNRVDVGFRSSGDSARGSVSDIKDESAMLTGDENIVDINYSVFLDN
jgi:membrane protease subunit HflK